MKQLEFSGMLPPCETGSGDHDNRRGLVPLAVGEYLVGDILAERDALTAQHEAAVRELGLVKQNERLAIQALTEAQREIERLRVWVDDLQSGLYVNCVYCGHRYGPGETTPVSMADALKAHVELCIREV